MRSESNDIQNALFVRLWRVLTSRRKLQLCLLLVLVIIASFCELLTVGAVAPFLLVLASPERLLSNKYGALLIQYLPSSDPEKIPFILTSIFIFLVLLAAAIRSVLNWAQLKVSYGIGIDFGIESYRRTLYQPYQTHINRNSSGVILAITQYTRLITMGVIIPVLMSVSASFLLVSIVAVLLLVDVGLTLLTGIFLTLIYVLLTIATKDRLTQLGKLGVQNDKAIAQTLQESFGGIRDVLIDGTQEVFGEIYRRRHTKMAQLDISFAILGSLPRYGVEAIAICTFAVIALFLTKDPGGFNNAIPALGAIALGAQRLLPLLQQLFANWSSVRKYRPQLAETLDLLEQPLPVWIRSHGLQRELAFNNSIKIDNLSFCYEQADKVVLSNLNYVIKRGGRIGVVGKTGSGKSTLVDILMGLLTPTGGALSVDGLTINQTNCRAWQNHVAHVPQAIFLADASIKENIAFGTLASEIDLNRVMEVARMAQLDETILGLPQGFETLVGERGVRLSGGQRQRIGIARALYKRADVIIFDEATSALDDVTEQSVMDSIRSLPAEITLIIVAHRVSTLVDCDEIIELERGKIVRIGSYIELFGSGNQK
jgi:ABC-type bacteriocin/lantibiotic exporter with double-glycine peptidase domain